jgi:enoyl-CoA hydratase/carnithine racemase
MRSKPAATPRTTVRFETDGPVATVTIDRPRVRNAVDAHTAEQLAECFMRFDADEHLKWPCSQARVTPSAPVST